VDFYCVCKKGSSFNLIFPAFVHTFAVSPLRVALVGDETCREINGGNISFGRSGDRIPAGGGARFFAPVQTSPGAHPASNTIDTASFPVVKRPGRDADHPPHLAQKFKKE